MSWQMALMAASTAFSAAQTYAQQKAQAKFGRAQAEIKRVQAIDNANAAKLQAAQQEVERRREFEEIRSYNLNQSKYDILSSPSFLALQTDNEGRLKDDITRIQLQALEQSRRFLLTAHSADVEGEAFRYMGKTAWMGATATLLKGGAKMAMLKGPSSSPSTSSYSALKAGGSGTGPAYPSSGTPKVPYMT